MNIKRGFKRLLIALTVIWLGLGLMYWIDRPSYFIEHHFALFIETTVAAWVLFYLVQLLIPDDD